MSGAVDARPRKAGSIAGLAVVAGCVMGLTAAIQAQARVSFSTTDGGAIHANVFGGGEHAVVLAHGGRFDKES
jgi:hypothetical protein